jgi:hypothetical protein
MASPRSACHASLLTREGPPSYQPLTTEPAKPYIQEAYGRNAKSLLEGIEHNKTATRVFWFMAGVWSAVIISCLVILFVLRA